MPYRQLTVLVLLAVIPVLFWYGWHSAKGVQGSTSRFRQALNVTSLTLLLVSWGLLVSVIAAEAAQLWRVGPNDAWLFHAREVSLLLALLGATLGISLNRTARFYAIIAGALVFLVVRLAWQF